jgi:hypothetical protein
VRLAFEPSVSGGSGRRAVMALEYLISAALGLGVAVLIWALLT